MSKRATVVVVVCIIGALVSGSQPALASVEGADNNFFGGGAGASNTGFGNSFFGGSAGTANTSGSDNSFFGRSAGLFNTSGSDNSFFGHEAGASNTTGGFNSFFGRGAGAFNTVGPSNSFFGYGAGGSNTTGADNAFFGRNTGLSNTTGDANAFFGAFTGTQNTTGLDNAFFGAQAGQNNTTGNLNSFFGRSAGIGNTTGFSNAFFGRTAGRDNTTGFENSFFGEGAGQNNTTGLSNSFFGQNAGLSNTTGSDNAFIGRAAGVNNTLGAENAVFGRSAGLSNTTENANTFLGYSSNGVGGITNATALGHRAQVSQSNSLVLGSINGLNGAASDVKVGMGTDTPAQALHVKRTDGTAELLVEEASGTTGNRTLFELTNNGAPRFFFNDTSLGGVDWQFSKLSNHNFTISDLGDGGAEMILQPNGVFRVGDAGVFDLVLDASGNLTIAGTLTESSDRAKKTDLTKADASKLLAALRQLNISTWRYKGDDLRHLGPMAQDFHRLFGLGTSTTIAPRDVASVALAVARELDRHVRDQARQIEELQHAVALDRR